MRVIIFGLMMFAFIYPYSVFSEAPLTLEESIDIALKNSTVLNIAREGSKEATAQKMEAMTGFLPRFSTSYSYTRLNEEPFSRFQGLSPGPLFGMNGMEIPVGTRDNYTWAVEVRQPVFAGGGILANYQASRIGEELARLEETAKYQDIVKEVNIAYFNILRAQKIQDVANQSVEMLKAHRDVAENYFRVGMIPKNDLLHAEVELANGKQSQTRARNAVEMAKSHFNTVLKREISSPVEVADVLAYRPFNQSFEECLNVAPSARPELKISLLRAKQAGKLVMAAQSEYLPSLNVVGNYARFGDHLSVAGSDYKDMESWYLMAVANWNFWEWGRTKFRVDAGKARENQTRNAAEELYDQVTLEIKNAYLMLKEAENQISVSQKLIEQAEENFRISEERYKVGIATSTEVLDAQTLLTKARSEYANALGDYNINYAKLQRAMGTTGRVDEDHKAAGVSKIDESNKTVEGSLKTKDSMPPESNEADKSEPPVAVAATAVTVAENSITAAPVAAAAVTGNPASSNEDKTTKSVPEEDIGNLVNQWLASWQSGDMKTYRSCYTTDFTSKRMDLNAWVSHKNKVHQKNKNISIRIENLKISPDAKTSTARAVFTQYYSSSILKDKVRKTLMLRAVNGEWKIFRETSVSLK